MFEKVINRVTITVMVACLFGGAIIGFAQEEAAQQGEAGQEQAEPEGKQWQDGKVEYDLYVAAQTATAAGESQKALDALDAWREKYPETDYEAERLFMYTMAYQGLQQPEEMYDSALRLAQMGQEEVGDQIYFQAIFFLTTLTTSTARTDAQFLANGEQYASETLEMMGAMQRPDNTPQDSWDAQMHQIEVGAQTTLGWVAMQRKDNAAAERELGRLLELDPQNAQASYWLGTVLLAQREPQKQFQAFWQFARAGNLTGDGAMPASNRQTVAEYLEKIYVQFHGDDSGLDELVEKALRSPNAPADLIIKSKEQIAAEEENRMMREQPELYQWLQVKELLTAAEGMQYFQSSMEGTMVRGLLGYVIAQDPPERPMTIVLGLTNRSTREVTLVLDQPYRYGAGRGTPLRFSAVPVGFTQNPFMLRMEVTQDDISGWPPPPEREQ